MDGDLHRWRILVCIQCSYSLSSGLNRALGEGGAYPECHVAQYPLGMGTKKVCGTACVPGKLMFGLR